MAQPTFDARKAAHAAFAGAALALVAALHAEPLSHGKPGVATPIDLRAYVFADDFSARWPTFPATSYDAAFGDIRGAWPFVHDQLKHIDSSQESGLYDGTEQWTETQVSPSGETQVMTYTRVMTSKTGVYLPMRDGGYAVLAFDAKTRAIEIKELYDSQGAALPIRDRDAATFFASRPLHFAPGERGRRGLDALADWARRNGVALSRGNLAIGDAPLECRGARTSGHTVELLCGMTPKPDPSQCLNCFTREKIWGLPERQQAQ
jgi:hypothetical protein